MCPHQPAPLRHRGQSPDQHRFHIMRASIRCSARADAKFDTLLFDSSLVPATARSVFRNETRCFAYNDVAPPRIIMFFVASDSHPEVTSWCILISLSARQNGSFATLIAFSASHNHNGIDTPNRCGHRRAGRNSTSLTQRQCALGLPAVEPRISPHGSPLLPQNFSIH